MATTFDMFKDAVRDADNQVDIHKTIDLFRKQLTQAVEAQAERDATIAPAFMAAFSLTEINDEGKRVPKRWQVPNLCAYVTMQLSKDRDNLSPEDQEELTLQVMGYLRNNSASDRKAGKPIRVAKGRGGCQLFANLPNKDDDSSTTSLPSLLASVKQERRSTTSPPPPSVREGRRINDQ